MPLRKPTPSRTDEAFIALTRTANHSVLWLGAAAVLALAGGKRGRRAAIHGLMAIGAASAVANGPLKFVFRRERPTRRPALIRKPTTYSFPSGHSASAFAFATAASADLPAAAPVLLPLASAVAYSRVRVGVHRIQDVVAGGALGVVCGAAVALATQPRRFVPPPLRPAAPQGSPDTLLSRLPFEVVLVTSPHAGGNDALAEALDEMRRAGLSVAEQLEIGEIERLPGLLRTPGGGPRLIVAAGGDGTVGAVADCLAATDSVLGILPLGTSNDFARSLQIPVDPRQAAALLTQGKVARVDLGRLLASGDPPRHFVHAATAGLNVTFARFAARASARERFGRLTYLAAAWQAFRERSAFDCELRYNGQTEKLTLTQLSVINAPAFGGALGLSVEGSDPDDRLLDVLTFEDMPMHRLLLATAALLLPGTRPLAGVRTLQVSKLHVHTPQPLAVALDGEVIGRLPGDFDVAGNALRVVTPREFVDVD